ncbi:MAG TPA: oligosaccharide flippase family protein [Puia sp.]|nr:oligosaccharide flippase family protein [Puia sp.]
MKKTADHILQHIVWRGLYYFSVLLINISIARFFAAEKSGQIFFIVNNLALILLVVSASLESGCAYYVASGIIKSSQISRFCLLWAIVASLVTLAIWSLLVYHSHPTYLNKYGFLAASFLFILGVLMTTYFTSLFNARKEFGPPNKILSLINILLLIVLFTGKNNAVIRYHFIQIYFACFFLQGLIIMLTYFTMETNEGVSLWPKSAVLKNILKYSLTALIANIIYFLVNRIDYWFVEYYCSPGDLGNYIQASKLAQMFLILPSIVGTTLFSIFSSPTESSNAKELATAIRILLWVNGGLALLIIGLGWYFIPLLFGTSFNYMYYLFILLVPGVLCVTMNYPLASWFSANKKIGVNIRGSLSAVIIICIGDIILLPLYGVRAASAVSSAGFFSLYLYGVYTYRKGIQIAWKDLLVIRKSDFTWLLKSLRTDIQKPLPESIAV